MRDTQQGFTRRQILKGGLFGAVALGAGGWIAARFTDGSPVALAQLERIGAAEQQMLARVADAVLDDLLPLDAAAHKQWLVRIVRNVDAGLATLPLSMQQETQKLLSMLASAPTRLLVTGQWAGWNQSREEVQKRLAALQSSSRELSRVAYRVLQDLVKGAFYGDRASWDLIGYSGPVVDFKQNG